MNPIKQMIERSHKEHEDRNKLYGEMARAEFEAKKAQREREAREADERNREAAKNNTQEEDVNWELVSRVTDKIFLAAIGKHTGAPLRYAVKNGNVAEHFELKHANDVEAFLRATEFYSKIVGDGVTKIAGA